jgi:hypothetical protein
MAQRKAESEDINDRVQKRIKVDDRANHYTLTVAYDSFIFMEDRREAFLKVERGHGDAMKAFHDEVIQRITDGINNGDSLPIMILVTCDDEKGFRGAFNSVADDVCTCPPCTAERRKESEALVAEQKVKYDEARQSMETNPTPKQKAAMEQRTKWLMEGAPGDWFVAPGMDRPEKCPFCDGKAEVFCGCGHAFCKPLHHGWLHCYHCQVVVGKKEDGPEGHWQCPFSDAHVVLSSE